MDPLILILIGGLKNQSSSLAPAGHNRVEVSVTDRVRRVLNVCFWDPTSWRLV